MENKMVFAVVGGDMRFTYLADALAAKQGLHKVYGMCMEKVAAIPERVEVSGDIREILPQCDIVIFPLPMLNGNGFINTPNSARHITPEECFAYISPKATVLGGMVPEECLNLAHRCNMNIVDYLVREELAILNAVPTAEGAVQIAMEEMPVTLFGARCLIVGYGRIAKVLAKLLHAFGASVRVAARKCSDLAWVRANGLEAVHIDRLTKALEDVDVVFNTAPSVLLNAERLSRLKKDCLVIDLASKPGGVDFNMAKELGIKTVWALSLPGKVAPVTAAEIILDTIFNILHERGSLI